MNKLIGGYTTNKHLLLDLDNVSYYKAYHVAREIMKCYPDVGDCLIIKCSDDSWHLVYDNHIGWPRIMEIVNCLALLNILEKGYIEIREFRGDITLRTTDKLTLNKYRPRPQLYNILANRLSYRKDGLMFCYLRFLWASARKPQSERPKQPRQPVQPLDLSPSVKLLIQSEILKRLQIWQLAAM